MSHPQNNKTILSIDYGTRRIGLAKSDPMGIIASALTSIDVASMKDAVNKVRGVIEDTDPTMIVVGYPLLPSGDRGALCDEIDTFIGALAEFFDGTILRVDEADTSEEAAAVIRSHGKKASQDKKRVDRIAAVLILQRYLDEGGGQG